MNSDLEMYGKDIKDASVISNTYYEATDSFKLGTDGVTLIKLITIADSIYFVTASNDTFGPIKKK